MPATALVSAETSAEAGILLSLLGAASNGNDISHMVPEVLKAMINKPASIPHVRKLAYEVCRHAILTESDYRKLWESVAGDVSGSDPEVMAAALRFIACLPTSQLADRFVIGQLSELLKPCLAAEAAIVRAAAIQTLSHVLLLHEVQHAAASSVGLANTYEGLWDEVTDSLLDERPFVVGQAAAAAAQLLAFGIDGGANSFSGVHIIASAAVNGPAVSGDGSSMIGFMMSRFANRAALRLSTALGPVLDMCSRVPAPGQVAVCDMLLALTRRVLMNTVRAAAAGEAAPPMPAGVPVPNLASLVTSVASYLANQLHSGDAAACTEASGAVLELAADLAAAGPAAGGAAAGLPQCLTLGAVDALLQLQDRELMEAGLGDICEVLSDALPALLPEGRANVLRKLWPLAGRIDDVSRRARVFSVAWKTAVASEMAYRTGSVMQPGSSTTVSLTAPLAASAVSASSDPLGLLTSHTVPSAAPSTGAGGGAKPDQTAGVVTSVPSSCGVAALLREPFVAAIVSGKAPAVEERVSFSARQASFSASAPSGSSLLNSVTNRTAPSPPLPLSRVESVRSVASGTTSDGGKGVKSDKEKKSGVFGSRFFRKNKGRGEPDGDPGSVSSASAPAHEEAAAAVKQVEETAAAAATQQAAAAPPSPRSPIGSNGALSAGPFSATSAGDVAAAILARAALSYATLRHELLQCLLQQLAHHPAAAVAAELCAEHVAAARHDRNPPTHTSNTSASAASLARRLGDTVQWVAMTSEVLSDTSSCVAWEPYVMPAITANPRAPQATYVPVDFNNLTADLWLGLLQAAMQAARSAEAFLGRMVAEAVDATAATAGGAQTREFTGLGYGTPYGLTAAGPEATQLRPELTAEAHYRALLSYLKDRVDVLQKLLTMHLSSWSVLSASVRPRVAWVAAHCLPLQGHWDDRWELLLGCLDSLLLRGTDVLSSSKRHDLLGSALAGGLYKAGRQAWTDPSKPFLFDIASASALCEAPEYEALGLLVALTALQQLAALLVNAVADAVPHGHAGAVHGQAAAVAKRLEAVLRHFIGTEVAASPHVRDWCKRILRYLATIMTYTPPVNLPPLVAALGVIAKQEHQAGGAAAPDDDDDSSDASSVYQPVEGQPELPPALAAAAAAAVAAAAAASTHAHDEATANERAGNGEAAQADGVAIVDEAAKQRAARSYLVHSAAAALPMWGYPFAPLSAVALHNSKRERRHRALSKHLADAAAVAEAPRPTLAAALRPLQTLEDEATTAAAPPASGPVLSSRSQYRLDSEAFWSALPHTRSPWQELTGPADPLLLQGCYVLSGPTRGDAATITVLLSAVNRLPVELSDVEVALKISGPLLTNTRRPAIWELPRLAAQDRAVESFTVRKTGAVSVEQLA
ncbi:hypothetical protein Vafri_4310 [Volvox africanus]|uniref:Uncharacterized protein n=1 Tax=Volvox africanus TaxID=51714 RepID=A0A8J4AW11_9CHLO|nr:hypothetical protein Vafri_4310 [Volvox africanus]